MTQARSLIMALLVAFSALTMGSVAAAQEVYVKSRGFGAQWEHALNGYDTVSYHQSGPVIGSTEFQTTYKGATWLFSSQRNLDLFLSNPDAYRPQYGGHCAYALAVGNGLQHGDPKVWTLHNGKLYLNLSKGVQRRWLRDKDGFIAKADPRWAELGY